MIRYSLSCAEGHAFESWFASAETYETLRGTGQLVCAICGGGDVGKTLMAPAVRPARKAAGTATADGGVAAGPAADRPLSQPLSAAEEALAALRREVEANSEYVGLRFAAEARAIHDGEAPERSIHGEARADEALRLIEDGIRVAPLPFTPKRKAN